MNLKRRDNLGDRRKLGVILKLILQKYELLDYTYFAEGGFKLFSFMISTMKRRVA
jgi:hypothetical protein